MLSDVSLSLQTLGSVHVEPHDTQCVVSGWVAVANAAQIYGFYRDWDFPSRDWSPKSLWGSRYVGLQCNGRNWLKQTNADQRLII